MTFYRQFQIRKLQSRVVRMSLYVYRICLWHAIYI